MVMRKVYWAAVAITLLSLPYATVRHAEAKTPEKKLVIEQEDPQRDQFTLSPTVDWPFLNNYLLIRFKAGVMRADVTDLDHATGPRVFKHSRERLSAESVFQYKFVRWLALRIQLSGDALLGEDQGNLSASAQFGALASLVKSDRFQLSAKLGLGFHQGQALRLDVTRQQKDNGDMVEFTAQNWQKESQYFVAPALTAGAELTSYLGLVLGFGYRFGYVRNSKTAVHGMQAGFSLQVDGSRMKIPGVIHVGYQMRRSFSGRVFTAHLIALGLDFRLHKQVSMAIIGEVDLVLKSHQSYLSHVALTYRF